VLPRLALIAALLVLPLAGCGTSQKDQYRKDFQKVANQFRSSVDKAGAQVRSGASLKQRVPALRSFKASLDKLASDLSRLDPPSDLTRQNADAVRQLRTLSSDLSDYERAAVAGDQAGAAKAVPKLQADQTLLQKTLDALDSKVSG
jgi:thiamine biosynthesis lipoprotein ApbE